MLFRGKKSGYFAHRSEINSKGSKLGNLLVVANREERNYKAT